MAEAGAVLAGVDTISATLDAVSAAATGSAEWTGADRAAVLAGLDRLGALLATTRGRWLLAEREAGTSVRTGDADFTAAVARRTRSGHGTAARQVQQAEALAALPTVADAVTAGTVPLPHLDPLARTIATASDPVGRVLTSPDGQARVLALARTHDAPAFARELARWTATLDPAALERDHQTQRRHRYLHLTDRPDGTHLTGRLDRMAGHRLRLALEATGETPDPDRAPEQARADALLALAEHTLTAPRTPPGAAVRPHVSLVLTEHTYAHLRTTFTRDDTAPAGTQTDGTAPPATLDDGTPVPVSEVARILCDCELTRIVVDADGTPVNLGRTRRLYTGPQRRAVILRDQTCAFGDCGRPARWCEVHHIRWWDRDTGPTDLDNAVLLCSYHHHEVHRQHLTIHRTGQHGPPDARTGARAAYTITTPDGRTLTGPPPDPPHDPRPGEPPSPPPGATPGAPPSPPPYPSPPGQVAPPPRHVAPPGRVPPPGHAALPATPQVPSPPTSGRRPTTTAPPGHPALSARTTGTALPPTHPPPPARTTGTAPPGHPPSPAHQRQPHRPPPSTTPPTGSPPPTPAQPRHGDPGTARVGHDR